MIANSKTFEQMLQENLILYTVPSEVSSHNLYSSHRELSIARYALENQAKIYHQAMEMLQGILDRIESASNEPTTKIPQILVAINTVESKSKSLIDSVKEIASILNMTNNIDVDKSSLRTILQSLPSLVKDTIAKVFGDEKKAEEISLALNNKISEYMKMMQYADAENNIDSTSVQHITYNQYNQMINSVPTQPALH